MGRKRGMTRLYDDKGHAVVVTVIEVEPNVITQIKNVENDGYNAIQTGFEEITTKKTATIEKRVNKPQLGLFKKTGIAPRRVLAESRIDSIEGMNVGDVVDVSIFEAGNYVDVTGVSKGKGFQGAMKKYGFRGGRATHGTSKAHRKLGSTGMRSTPGRCFPGGKRASHMGDETKTVQSLLVVDVNKDENVIVIKGAVPGPRDGLVYMQSAIKKTKKN